jgi:hypothetical protein
MASTIVTGEALQLDLAIDSASWEGSFDTLEIWRSRTTEGGPYEPLMGETWSPARIPSVQGEAPTSPETGRSVPVVGKELQLLINERDAVNLTFTGVTYLTLQQAATQIQTASAGLLKSFVLNGKLVIETVQPGAGSLLRVVGGDAAPLLGLPTSEPDSIAFGFDARIPLVKDSTGYVFTDPNGSKDYFYRARFFNTVSRQASSFGTAFTGRSFAAISGANIVTGWADFVDSTGIAKKNQEILVYTRMDGLIIEGKVVVPSGPTRLLSDENGHVELQLVRGTYITVAVAGTDLVRDIVVPTDPAVSSFNLLDPSKGSNDLFKVRVPDLEYAARRSL